MALTLPIHDLRMDEPVASEVFQYEDKTLYNWVLTETEHSHIASMLNMESTRSKVP